MFPMFCCPYPITRRQISKVSDFCVHGFSSLCLYLYLYVYLHLYLYLYLYLYVCLYPFKIICIGLYLPEASDYARALSSGVICICIVFVS